MTSRIISTQSSDGGAVHIGGKSVRRTIVVEKVPFFEFIAKSTLACGALLAAFGCGAPGPVNGGPNNDTVTGNGDLGETMRLRAQNYSFVEVTWDVVDKAAPPDGADTGFMEFMLVVDQPMLDQFAAILAVNGTIEVKFSTRIGNSFVGNGHGTVRATWR